MERICSYVNSIFSLDLVLKDFKRKQGRKRPLDTPKKMIERGERERRRERER